MKAKLLLSISILLLFQTLLVNSETITCKNIVARFKGVFQNNRHSNNVLAVDFQTRVNSLDFFNRTVFTMDFWNNENVKFPSDVKLWARDSEHDWAFCNPFDIRNCGLSYVNTTGFFELAVVYSLNGAYQNEFGFLYFPSPSFNSSFTFDAVDETCTNIVPSFPSDYGSRTELYKACMCCDTYNPKAIACKNIIARFKGVFQNDNLPNAILAVDLQAQVSAIDFFNRTFFTMNYWNNDNVNLQSGIQFWARDFEHDWTRCDPPKSNNCSLLYVSKSGYFVLELGHFSHEVVQNWFQFLYFPNYRNHFNFNSIDGKCTNVVQGFPNQYAPRTELFKACMCCNDYDPSSSLNCP